MSGPGPSGGGWQQGRPALGQRPQPQALPGAALVAEAAQGGQAQAEDADHAGGRGGRQLQGGLGQMPGMVTQQMRILHARAMGPRQQRGDGHHQPVPFHAPRRPAAGAVPIPAFPREDAEALLNPDPQAIDLQRNRGRRLIREQEPGVLLVGPPPGHQGAAALAAAAKGSAGLHPALALTRVFAHMFTH